MKKFYLGIQIGLVALGMLFSSSVEGQINTFKFEQIDSLMKVEQRPVFVFIHTDWCQFCLAMKNKTFEDSLVIENMNEKYYFVDFNGEQKEDVVFFGDTFSFKQTGYNTGLHELTEALGELDGKISYPTTCILNTTYQIVFQYNAFLDEKYLLELLNKGF